MLSKLRRRSGGFTLIELMIVIAIIAILCSQFSCRTLSALVAQGQLTACKSNLKNIGTALEMYSTDWSGKYPNPLALTKLTPNYLKSIPECPAAASNTYTLSSTILNPDNYQDYYYVQCAGANHKAVSVTANYPAYNGIQGLIERAP